MTGDRPAPCATVEAVRADLRRRAEFGLQKYGQPVADNPTDLRGWLQHAFEETLDKAVYLKRAIQEIDAKEGRAAAGAIASAALRTPTGLVVTLPKPARHHQLMDAMWRAGIPAEIRLGSDQGFITSDHRFVDRKEAFAIAKAAGQLIGNPVVPGILFTEDLW